MSTYLRAHIIHHFITRSSNSVCIFLPLSLSQLILIAELSASAGFDLLTAYQAVLGSSQYIAHHQAAAYCAGSNLHLRAKCLH
jgi:hypothetical protein